MQGDLTVPANVEKLFDAAIDAFGGVDIAINTVGKVLRKPFVEPLRPNMIRCSASTPRRPTSSCSKPVSG